MNKNERFRSYHNLNIFTQNLLKLMRVFIILLALGLSSSYANTSYSQPIIDISIKDASLVEFFDEIQLKTEYVFFYKDDILKEDVLVSVNMRKTSLDEILLSVFSHTSLRYSISGKQVIVKRVESPAEENNLIDAQEQQETITLTGMVTESETGMPLPGANIVETGTTNGVMTDFDGNYMIQVPIDATLEISYIGYATKVVQISDQSVLNIALDLDAAALDEVVVVGYGTQSLVKVSGSIGKAPIGDLQDYSVSNFDQALAGKLAGVQVLQTSGEPGRELNIKVRGTGTITAGADPLYVVDGVPIPSAGQATEVVNMEDIESLQVLKDAASAAIYGSRGANGVILITTKKGKEGQMKVNFNHSIGFQEVSKKIDMMDAYQYARLSRDAHNAAYLQDVPTGSPNDPNDIRPIGYQKIPEELFPYLNDEQGLTDTDWQDEIYRRAILKRYNLSLNGGNENVDYYVSANHSEQEGIILNSDYQKTSLRANLNVTSGRVKIGLNLSPSYTVENRVNANGTWSSDGVVQAALASSPTWPVYNADNSYNFSGNGFWRIGTDYQHNEILNPVAVANEIYNNIEHYNFLGNIFVEYEVIDDLILKSSFATNFNGYQNEYYRPSHLQLRGANNYNQPANPEARMSNTNIYNWIWENSINYKKSFGYHNIDLLGAITAQKDRQTLNRTAASVTSDTPVTNAIQVINADQVTDSDAGIEQWSLYSLLSRAQYDYAGKYIVSASIRADASSRFGANNKWGYFPSISGAWRLSQEDFMIETDWVDEFKLRASYGITGNFQIGNYRQMAAITRDNYILGNPGHIQTGLRPSQLENPDLSWEKTAMFNTGLDVDLFNRQLGFVLDYYNSTTSDLLLEVPIPYSTGFGSALQNVGEVNNWGVEAAVRIAPDLGNFNWTGNFNISLNRNEVKALGPENTDIITTAGTGHAFFITRVGHEIGSYYLLIQDGIFSNQEQLNQYPHFPNTQVGDFRFVDVNQDGILDVNEDRTIVGNYAPDFTYGFSNSFSYKGFDLNIAFQGTYGNEILNLSRRYIANSEGNFNNMAIMNNRWLSESNPGNQNINRANRKASGNNGRTSTWHVEDGTYLRLQNVSFGYSFPQSVIDNLNFDRLRVYLTGNNIHTWSNYTGYNPEVNLAGGQLTPGLDYGVYPLATTYSIGVNISF